MAETLVELQAQLLEVNNALTKARKAVSTGQGGKTISRDYKTLLEEKKMRLRKIDRIEGNKPMVANADMSGGE